MIAIGIYWLVGIFVFLNLGKLLERMLGIKHNDLFFSIVNGLFLFTIYFSFFAIFTGVFNFFSHLLLVIIIIYSVWTNMEFSSNRISQWIVERKKKSIFHILIFFVFLLLSAQIPYFHVNETYYIQTIKWAGEHGLTKGLINLHPYLGKFSTWHILQAGFNPGFFIFNDINGLLLISYFLFLLCKVNKMREKTIYTFGDRLLLLYFMVFPGLLLFINSPSPDLPVIIFSQIAFYFFIKNYYDIKREEFIQLLILVLFATLIKNTAIPLFFLPLILLIRHRKIIQSKVYLNYSFIFFLLIIFLAYKNYIITGYPLFPFSFFGKYVQADWKYPIEVLHKYIDTNKANLYGGNISTSGLVNFYHWLFNSDFRLFVMNYIWFISLLIFPFFIQKHSHKKALSRIYLLAVIYFIILFFHAPYLGYFIYFEILFIVLMIDRLFNIRFHEIILKGIYTLVILFSLALFFSHSIKFDMLYNPLYISKYKNYENKLMNDFILNFPSGEKLFWETGDAFLPAAQPEMLDSLLKTKDTQYHLILRGENLSKGFRLNK